MNGSAGVSMSHVGATASRPTNGHISPPRATKKAAGQLSSVLDNAEVSAKLEHALTVGTLEHALSKGALISPVSTCKH